MRIAPEAIEKRTNLLVDHGVAGHDADEFGLLIGRWQFAIQEQVASLKVV
jgi:hypothetical protein